jgi:uncharacterized protein (TIGR02145 family)
MWITPQRFGNSVRCVQGEAVAAKAPAAAESGGSTLKDARDGKTYKTVTIGKQTWMAENLNYEAESSLCYGNDQANCNKYGRLYDWNTAMNVCPNGWHLPSNDEWGDLAIAAGGTGEYVNGCTDSKKLKAKSGWDENGTDDFGFSALPDGDRSVWWTATESEYAAYYRFIINKELCEYGGEGEEPVDKATGYSVRCVRN